MTNYLSQHLGEKAWRALFIFTLAVGGLWALVELADGFVEGSTKSIDESVLLLFRSSMDHSDPVGPRWFEQTMQDLTALGSVGVLVLFTLLSIGYLLLVAKKRLAIFLFVTVGSGMILSFTLKSSIARPRPSLVPHETFTQTASFPSAHSLLSALTYLTLAGLLCHAQRSHRTKVYLIASAILLTLLIGISRIYLGVHWPTDVLAGWTLGSVWALLGWFSADYLEHRGTIEHEETESA